MTDSVINQYKPVILVFVPYYLPGYQAGGPIRTIANMVERLGDEFDFKIVTMDRDLGAVDPYPDVEAGSWVPCGKALVWYVSPNSLGLKMISDIVKSTPHNVIYLNSFFNPLFTQQVLVDHRLGCLSGRPIVIAPRGEFSEGALQLKSLKKKAFIVLAKLFNLYDGLTWHASSIYEVEDIQRVMSVGKKIPGNFAVAGNLTSIKALNVVLGDAPHRQRRVGIVRACFLSRISPKKNLDFALRILESIRVSVIFSIYGPIEDAQYWGECQALIEKLPSNVEVAYEGLVEPAQVVSTLAQNDLFLFPTLGENFGHVIFEALRAGLPILVSDQTPWRQLAEKGVGWDLPLGDVDKFVNQIEEVAAWSDKKYKRWSLRASSHAAKVAEDPAIVESNRRLFLDAIGGSKLAPVVSDYDFY